MEELLIKYMFDECTASEKDQVEVALKTDPKLLQDFQKMKRLDQIMDVKNILIPASKDLKFRLLDQLIPAIKLDQNDSKSYIEYLLPVLFTVGSIVYFLFYSNIESSSKWTVHLNLDYMKYFSLAGVSMIGLLV
ncbi:MAG: hypothetical protein RLZZ546_214, partial [Bacteroidota bacterium]